MNFCCLLNWRKMLHNTKLRSYKTPTIITGEIFSAWFEKVSYMIKDTHMNRSWRWPPEADGDSLRWQPVRKSPISILLTIWVRLEEDLSEYSPGHHHDFSPLRPEHSTQLINVVGWITAPKRYPSLNLRSHEYHLKGQRDFPDGIQLRILRGYMSSNYLVDSRCVHKRPYNRKARKWRA